MKKRKNSTFERLQSGKLNRKQRKELQQRLYSADPGLEIVNPDAAGIDVGNESHFVSVPPWEGRATGAGVWSLDRGAGGDGPVVKSLWHPNRGSAIHWGVLGSGV